MKAFAKEVIPFCVLVAVWFYCAVAALGVLKSRDEHEFYRLAEESRECFEDDGNVVVCRFNLNDFYKTMKEGGDPDAFRMIHGFLTSSPIIREWTARGLYP